MSPAFDRPLGQVLKDAIERGDLHADQAERILLAEEGLAQSSSSDDPSHVPLRGRLGPFAEVLGYIGATLAMVAVLLVVSEFWASMTSWSRVALPGAFTAGFLFAGASIGRSSGAIDRLGSFLWALAVGAAATTILVAMTEVASASASRVGLAVGATIVATGAPLWRLRPTALQQLAVFAGLGTLLVSGLGSIESSLAAWSGLALWGLGASWCILAWGALVRPNDVAWTIGAATTLIGPIVIATGGHRWSSVVGLASATAIVGISVSGASSSRRPLLVLSIAGLFGYVPAVVFTYFGTSLGAPVALLVTGVLLVAVAVGLTKASPRIRTEASP